MSARRDLTGQLGRYRILQKIGEGGMGAVYLAEDTQLGRQVALKVPRFDGTTKPALIERFQREARIAAGIDHPNLCPVFDVGAVNGMHYFTMPFIQGTTLSELIDENKPWLPAVAAGLLRKVALAVAALHEKGIVHRDLKPSNIMIRPGGEPVLMDFGLARAFAVTGQRLTTTGAPLGSPSYMAPEQVAGSSRFSPATDVYGLGVIYYELITGKLPFVGPLLAVFAQILQEPPPPPSRRRPGVDPRLDAFCLKALAKKPEDRYPDTAALIAALEETLRQLAHPNQVTAPLAAFAPTPELYRDTMAVTKPTRRRALWLPLFALGVLLVLFLALKLLTSQRDDNSNPPTEAPAAYALDLNGVKMEFVHVGKGTFWMGSPENEADRDKEREEQKEVTMAEDFYIGKYEVTQAQWQAVMGNNPSYFSRTGGGKDEVKNLSDDELKQFPVEYVSWTNTQEFLKKLNEREKDRNSGYLYRLPREAEWEFSCRGGPFSSGEGKKTAPFYFAKPTFTLSSDQANFDGNYPYGGAGKGDYLKRPCQVGSYKANPLGIYDMHGNVWEWCDDLFQGGPGRVGRGGSWGFGGQSCRAAARYRIALDFRYLSIGLRVARATPATSQRRRRNRTLSCSRHGGTKGSGEPSSAGSKRERSGQRINGAARKVPLAERHRRLICSSLPERPTL